ncbi:kinase-like domain-containing protein [Xylaria sp. FL0933]|nr:kinase-like domain-containing protein [Xylaria sp. FL0933]
MDSSIEAKTIFEVHCQGAFIEYHHHKRLLVSGAIPRFSTDTWDRQPVRPVPDDDEGATPAPEEDPLPRFLRVTTDDEPKSTSVGYMFGSDKDVCDILVANDSKSGVSKMHFALQIEMPSGHGTLIFKSHARHGTRISTAELYRKLIQTQRAICENDRELRVYAGGHEIRIQFPNHHAHEDQWQKNWWDYCRRYSRQVPALNHLRIKSASTVSISWEGRYHLGDEIGSGNFGSVRIVTDARTGERYAAKTWYSVSNSLEYRKEVDLPFLKSLSHDSIIKFHEALVNPPALVMELVDGVDLKDSHHDSTIEGDELRNLTWLLADALTYLHDKNVIHRDLKPHNIMISARYPIRIKLIDFGISTNTEATVKTAHAGTPKYWAPEIASGRYTNKVDIWSLGVVILELSLGLPQPSKMEKWHQTLVNHVAGMASEETIRDDSVEAFIYSLLQLDPDQRPTAAECRDMLFALNPYIPIQNDTSVSPPRRYMCGLRPAVQHHLPSGSYSGSTVLNTTRGENSTAQNTTQGEGSNLQNADSDDGDTLRPTDIDVPYTSIENSETAPAGFHLSTSSRKRPASTEYSTFRQRTGFCPTAPTPKGGLSSRDPEDFEIDPEDLAIILGLPSPTQPRSPSPLPPPSAEHYPTPKGSASYQEWQRQKDEEENKATQGSDESTNDDLET